MYDLHTHILPGIDDGARTRDEALAMAKAADRDGTRLILATPHRRDVTEANALETIRGLVSDLNQELEQQGLQVRLILGMENHLDMDLPEAARQGKALTMNGSRYILVELPFFQLPNYVHEVLFQLQLQGLTPVIAHPERQAQIQEKPEVLAQLVERGALAQLTAGSLIGSFGNTARLVACRLVERRLIHVLASDCHRSTGDRSPGLSPGQTAATRLVGAEEARAMTIDTPQAFLEDLPFTPPEPVSVARRGWWAFWR